MLLCFGLLQKKQKYGHLLIVPPLKLFESKENVRNDTPNFLMRNQPLATPELLNNMVCNC